MRYGLLVVFGSALLVSSAHASFELLMVPSNTGTLQRMDAPSGASLGSFMTWGGSHTAILGETSGNVRVIGGTSSQFFNYSTGESTSLFDVGFGTGSGTYHDGFIWTVNNGGLRKLQGSSWTNVTPAGITVDAVTRSEVGELMLIGRDTSGNLIWNRYDTAGGAVTGSGTLVGASGLSTTAPVGGATYMTTGNRRNHQFTYRDNTNALRLGHLILNSVGTFLLSGTAPLTGDFEASTTRTPSLIVGHNDLYVVGAHASLSNTLTISKYGMGLTNAVWKGQYTTGGTVPSKFQMAMVVAPEPASVAGLALGCLALIRRRRMG